MEHARLGTVESPETIMVFGSCEVTCEELQTGRHEDLLDLLMRHGVKRLAAERILEIHCSGAAGPGRARSHATSRSLH